TATRKSDNGCREFGQQQMLGCRRRLHVCIVQRLMVQTRIPWSLAVSPGEVAANAAGPTNVGVGDTSVQAQNLLWFPCGNSTAAYVSNGQEMAPLPLRLDIVNHSPTGFAWAIPARPAQLAILADWMGAIMQREPCTKDSKQPRLPVFLKSTGR